MPDQFGVRRFVYKRLVAGDYLKLEAQSNTGGRKDGGEASGGGARDFRFSKRIFEPVFHAMFPYSDVRGSTQYRYRDDVRYGGDAGIEQCRMEIWPGTRSREFEIRIAQVNKIEALKPARLPAGGSSDVFLIIAEDAAGLVSVAYTTIESLHNDNWHPMVKNPIITTLAAATKDDPNVRGFVDLLTPAEDHTSG